MHAWDICRVCGNGTSVNQSCARARKSMHSAPCSRFRPCILGMKMVPGIVVTCQCRFESQVPTRDYIGGVVDVSHDSY